MDTRAVPKDNIKDVALMMESFPKIAKKEKGLDKSENEYQDIIQLTFLSGP